MPGELIGAVNAVGERNDRAQFIDRADVMIRQQELDHRHRVGETGHFDQHKIEIEIGRMIAPAVKIEQTGGDLLVHMAAQAAAVDDAHQFARRRHQHVVNADFAVFVDDDGGAGESARLEQAVDQRGLAAAEKPGDQQHRHARRMRRKCGQERLPASSHLFVGRRAFRGSVGTPLE